MSIYREEADALDAELLACIRRRSVPDFNGLALRIFAHQLAYNKPYSRYCASLGVTLESLPRSWEEIPPVPAAAFKEAALCTFDPSQAQLTFESSGTTAGQARGTHYMENAALYDAALLAGFHDALLTDVPKPMRYVLQVPNPQERPRSSLGYMMHRVADFYGDGSETWCITGDQLDVDRFVAAVREAIAQDVPVCIGTTAFALVQLLEVLRERRIGELALPPFSRIMETGGFKGRTRVVSREVLYADASGALAIPQDHIVAEYGMTELTSQYYDDAARVKRGPPWLKTRIVDPGGRNVPSGVVGSLVHVDLANRSTCIAVQTEDLGVASGDGGIVLLGREQNAELRGCSLDAEQLRSLQRV